MRSESILAGDTPPRPAAAHDRPRCRPPAAKPATPRQSGSRAGARIFDLCVACLALLAVWPVMILAALAIKLDSPGPVLFRQKRCGLDQNTFTILKFRTMRADDHVVFAQATRRDSRVTRVGAWLRRSSIDELPQLFNVIHGEMALVGPRPHAVMHDQECRSTIAGYEERARVKPGLTGWAQVNGLRGETRGAGQMEARVALDLWYVEHRSFTLDIRILVRTALEVMKLDAY